jgi:hypothetical protein
MNSKKHTTKKKSGRISHPLTPPDMSAAIRVFDVGGGQRLTGTVIGEDNEGITLEWPAAMSISLRQAEADVEYRVRFEPVAFAGSRYKLYRNAIRGECYRTEPSLVLAYEGFRRRAEGGGYDLRPPVTPQPDVAFKPTETPASEAPVVAGG